MHETLRKTLRRAGPFAAVAGIALFGATQVRAQAIGWVWNNNPSTPGTTTPDASYSYNSSGGAISATRNAEGDYTVLFAGLGNSLASDVQATAYGGGANFCVVGSWSSSNGTDVAANVFCYNTAGSLADNSFTLLYQARSSDDAFRAKLAFLWANEPTTANYTPDTSYQYNETGGTNTITRNGAGSYTANLPGLTRTGGTVLVTAYGSTAARCQAAGWTGGSSGTDVNVTCTNAAGVATDEMFDLVYSILETAGYGQLSNIGGAIWAFNDTRKTPYDVSGKYSVPFGFFKMYSQRIAKGAYVWTITVDGDAWISTTVLATAYGVPGNYCNTNSWQMNSTTISIYVNCFNAAGAPADTQFTATFQVAQNF
jgi:hypothetical protein